MVITAPKSNFNLTFDAARQKVAHFTAAQNQMPTLFNQVVYTKDAPTKLGKLHKYLELSQESKLMNQAYQIIQDEIYSITEAMLHNWALSSKKRLTVTNLLNSVKDSIRVNKDELLLKLKSSTSYAQANPNILTQCIKSSLGAITKFVTNLRECGYENFTVNDLLANQMKTTRFLNFFTIQASDLSKLFFEKIFFELALQSQTDQTPSADKQSSDRPIALEAQFRNALREDRENGLDLRKLPLKALIIHLKNLYALLSIHSSDDEIEANRMNFEILINRLDTEEGCKNRTLDEINHQDWTAFIESFDDSPVARAFLYKILTIVDQI